MTNREKILALVSGEDTKTREKNQWRINNRAWLRESQEIAMKVLDRLDELGWTQKQLAEAMDVSPQYVNKIVKGSENLTLETIAKLQKLLDISILSSSFNNENASEVEKYFSEEFFVAIPSVLPTYELSAKQIQIEYNSNFDSYTYQKVG